MAGTNAAAAKKALIDLLAALPALDGVQVAYSWPGRSVERECIYAGRVTGPVQLAAMGGTRVSRQEDLVLNLHIVVDKVGQEDLEASDVRACALGAIVEELVAGNPTLGVSGLKVASIVGVDLDGGTDDETAEAVLTYQVGLKSHLS